MAVALLSLIAGACYNRWFNPGTEWIFKLHHIKQAALKKSLGHKRILVAGGSSVLFGIDAAALERETGIPTVNLGLTAGLGGLFILGYAERSAQPGDIIVLSLEPDLFAEAPRVTDGGGRFSVLLGSPGISNGSAFLKTERPVTTTISRYLRAGNPGLPMLVNDQTRRMLGMASFRYVDCGVDALGFSYGKVDAPYETAQRVLPFDREWSRVLTLLRKHLESKGISVYYSAPWLHVGPADRESLEQELRASVEQIGQSIPVLGSPSEAIQVDPQLFSDTHLHLSSEGATLRTRRLAQELQQTLGLDGQVAGSPASREGPSAPASKFSP